MMDHFDILRRVTRALAPLRGFRRVSEAIQRHYAGSDVIRVIRDFDGDLRFRCFLNSHISGSIHWAGSYSGSQLVILGRILRPEMTFIDIGANEGEHTVFAAKRLMRGQVISFEPSREIFAMLSENVRLNGFQNVVLVERGLSDGAGTAQLYAGDARHADGSVNFGVSSLHPREGVRKEVGTIQLDQLDDYVRRTGVTRVDVMKIDVEGSELAVLRGARETIERFRPMIFVEVNEATSKAGGYEARSLLDFLVELGYRFERIENDGSTIPLTEFSREASRDVLCMPLART